MTNKICVYAICKNEAQFVERWYESVKDADYICVLDTGSTDDTVDLLKKHEDVIIEQKEIIPWRFDVARNESMKLIPEDANILVSLDLDEVLSPGWADVLKDNWNEEVHTRAEYTYIWSHLENGAPGRVFMQNKIHGRSWGWKFPVHETLWNYDLDSGNYLRDNALNVMDKLTIEHFADNTKSRSSYLELLELRASEDKEDTQGLLYLAHEYYYQRYYEKSIRKLQSLIDERSDDLTKLELANCYLFMGDNYAAIKQPVKAIESYMLAIETEPTYREPYIGCAQLYLDTQKYDLSICYAKEGIRKGVRYYSWLERDNSWSFAPYDILAIAYYYTGEKLKALACGVVAAEMDPQNTRLTENVRLIKQTLTNDDFT